MYLLLLRLAWHQAEEEWHEMGASGLNGGRSFLSDHGQEGVQLELQELRLPKLLPCNASTQGLGVQPCSECLLRMGHEFAPVIMGSSEDGAVGMLTQGFHGVVGAQLVAHHHDRPETTCRLWLFCPATSASTIVRLLHDLHALTVSAAFPCLS